MPVDKNTNAPGPLQSVSLRFPQTVGTPECPAYIRFRPEKVEYAGMKGLNSVGRTPNPANNAAAAAGAELTRVGITTPLGGISQLKNQLKDIGGRFENALTQAREQLSPENILNNVRGEINVGGFKVRIGGGGGGGGDGSTTFTQGTINLFLPEGLQSNNAVSYRAGGGMLAKTLIEGQQTSGKFSSADAIESLKNNAGALGKEAVINMMDAATDNVTKDVYAATTGKVANNFSFQFFDSVDHRSFSYTFEMIPTNAAESSSINDICDMFQEYMLPKRDGQGFYEIPSQWDISYIFKDGKVKMQQPNKCFLQNVNISYNDAAGNALHQDGTPFKTTLQLDFIEIEPLYRAS